MSEGIPFDPDKKSKTTCDADEFGDGFFEGNHEGFFDKPCPKCGKRLIINDAGAVWCEDEMDCDYRSR